MEQKYAGCPTAFVYTEPKSGAKKIRQLLWGDWVLAEPEGPAGWRKVKTRNQAEWKKEGDKWVRVPREGWMKANELQDNKLLEVYFVDIGQGDGCLVITPDDKVMLIDAGEEDNMWRFLKWKFNTKNTKNPPMKIQHTIISHSDSDHYKGFTPLFKDERFEFENIFHNGLVERVGDSLLGKIENGYHTEIITNDAELKTIIDDPAKVGRKLYPKLLKGISGRGAKIRMLCNEDDYLEGYEKDKALRVKVLGPAIEKQPNGKRKLKRFDSNDGKTKNGHSIILRFEYGKVKILLGGDLNRASENYLLKQYTGIDPENASAAQKADLVKKAKDIFGVDIAKACHHGAADFTDLFIQATNAAATVVSSGDAEPHAHPRPECLGAMGKYGRGSRPLIFSTELARSAQEAIKNPKELHDEIDAILELQKSASNPELIEKLNKRKEDLKMKIQRTVTVYGMINLRTDGERVVLAQRLEEKAARGDWDFCELKPNSAGIIAYESKHSDDE